MPSFRRCIHSPRGFDPSGLAIHCQPCLDPSELAIHGQQMLPGLLVVSLYRWCPAGRPSSGMPHRRIRVRSVPSSVSVGVGLPHIFFVQLAAARGSKHRTPTDVHAQMAKAGKRVQRVSSQFRDGWDLATRVSSQFRDGWGLATRVSFQFRDGWCSEFRFNFGTDGTWPREFRLNFGTDGAASFVSI
jgi:hypothetical protein